MSALDDYYDNPWYISTDWTSTPSMDQGFFLGEDVPSGISNWDDLATSAGLTLDEVVSSGFFDTLSRYGQQGLDALKSFFVKPASQGGGVNWRGVMAAGGALAPVLESMLGGGNRPASYQGEIPKYTAVREQVPGAYDPNRRPGSGGQRYFSDVQYTPTSGDIAAAQAAVAQQAQGLASLNAANPLNAAPPAYQPPAPPPATTQPAPTYDESYSGANVLKAVREMLGTQNLARGGIVGLQDGGFVVPADVVSHLGNGSTDAGLAHLTRKGAVPIRGKGDGMSDSNRTTINGRQPAAVADGEAYLPPRQVQNMGGAEKLYAMMDKIRRDRTGSPKQGKQINPNQYV